jgi:hypothetical protein
MRVDGRFIYADPGKVLDFAEARYAMDEDNIPVRQHLYSPMLRMGRMDKP